MILKNIQKLSYSEVVLAELLAALRNFSREPKKLTLVSKMMFNSVIKIAKQPPNDKLQTLSLQCLNNFSRLSEFDQHIRTNGGQDLYLMAKQDQFAFDQNN